MKFDTHPVIQFFARLEAFIKYSVLRPVVSLFSWYAYGKKKFRQNAFTRTGEPLKMGISIIIPAKNEEYSLKPCLESLIGIAEQFILIDNGSEDKTLEIMKEFAEKSKNVCDVIVLEKPSTSLIEMRQEGLDYVKYNWVIRGDADMVFTSEMYKIKQYALKQSRATAIFLKKLNFFGDLNHINRLDSPYSGEYFLRNFDNNMRFKEFFGRLEHAPLPLYYKMTSWEKVAFYHIDCNKPNDRLIYRTCYLDWRETLNNLSADKESLKIKEFEYYQRLWNQHNFGTTNPALLNYRYSRLIASACKPLDENLKKDFPEPLRKQLNEGPFRFFLEYQGGRPFLRHDRNETKKTMLSILDTELEWEPSMERFRSDKKRKFFSID